jgi:nucleotide-binding universal stress UspA family protein
MSKPSILVGVDDSEHGVEALGLAVFLARATYARLLVAAVERVDPYSPGVPGTETALRRQVARALEGAGPGVAGALLWEPRAIEANTVPHGLHELAERDGADLIVVGSTHRGALRRRVPGSVGRRVIHCAPCAVAVAPRGYRAPRQGEVKPVGAAFDASPESARALAAAACWATTLKTELRVVHVLDPPDPANPIYGAVSYAETLGHLREDARHSLALAVAGLEGSEPVSTALLEGEPAAVLARQSEGMSLLFVGSRSYGPLRRVLLGSVSGDVVDTAACPVVVAPRSARHEMPAASAPRASVVAAGPSAPN